MYRRVECRPSGYPRQQVNHRSRRQAADARSRPEARPLASRFGASNPLSVFTEVAAFLVHGSGRRPKASSNSPTRRFAAHALHALLVGAALLLRAVRGFLGPTTIPYSTTNARSGRYIQMDVCTHTPRARGTHAPQAVKAGWHGEHHAQPRLGPWVACVSVVPSGGACSDRGFSDRCMRGACNACCFRGVSAATVSQPTVPPCIACFLLGLISALMSDLVSCVRRYVESACMEGASHTPRTQGQARRLPTSVVHAGSSLMI